MGKKIRDISDPTLAKGHKKGAKVMWVHPCLHDKFGKIMFAWPHYWLFNYRIARKAHQRLKKYQNEILNIEISNSNDRHIYDSDFIEKLYRAGFELTANIYISFEHLTLEIIRGVYRNDERTRKKLLNSELKVKLNHIVKKIFFSPDLVSHSGYVKLFSEFENKRHAFNHPLEDNVYNISHNWDLVPLAWIISGKYESGFKEIEKFLEIISTRWQEYIKENDKPAKINIIRGIKSGHQYKKPRKESKK